MLRKGWLPFKELYEKASPEQEVGYKFPCSMAVHVRSGESRGRSPYFG